MPDFMFAYHGGGGMPATKEEGEKMMAAWNAWFGSMGTAVVDGGRPVGKSSTVSKSGVTGNGGANPISGYSIIRAKDLAAATEMAKGCPLVKSGNGTVEVAEAIAM
ncbi:MAG: hypothetical protein WBA91_14680 [Paracoccaceae bacterium]